MDGSQGTPIDLKILIFCHTCHVIPSADDQLSFSVYAQTHSVYRYHIKERGSRLSVSQKMMRFSAVVQGGVDAETVLRKPLAIVQLTVDWYRKENGL